MGMRWFPVPDAANRRPGAGARPGANADVVLRIAGLRKFYGTNEMAGETAFCYANDARPLLAAQGEAHGVRERRD